MLYQKAQPHNSNFHRFQYRQPKYLHDSDSSFWFLEVAAMTAAVCMGGCLRLSSVVSGTFLRCSFTSLKPWKLPLDIFPTTSA